MNYEELVEYVKDAVKNAEVSKTIGHVAFQFNVTGEAEGAFYLEIDDGKVFVEPYEYFDRDTVIVASASVITEMAEGKIQPMVAYANGQLQAYGNIQQLKVLPFGCCCKSCGK